jgi:hypothetical protein
LPDAQLAIVEQRKITRHLLASGHPAGRAKAAFFERFGFRVAEWGRLRDALLEHARSTRSIFIADTEFGRKYVLEGPLTTPDGRKPRVRTVWFVAIGETVPRLVTAYAAPGGKR